MPIDRGIIDQQLQALGEGTRWWDERELRDLPAVLEADERILAISRGKIARVRWLRRSWLIVVTDRRLLCLRSGSGTSWRHVEVSAAQIRRVALRVGLFRGRVVIAAAGQTYRLLVPRPDGYKLQAVLSSLITSGKPAIPGFAPTRMVHRVIDHMLALPAAALSPEELETHRPPPLDLSQIDDRIHVLEDEIRELREQVHFLEDLLRQRHEASTVVEEYRSG